MATGKASGKAPGERRPPLPMLAALLVLAAALTAWFWQPMKARAVMAAAYDARLACSCRYVAGRSLEQCRGDLDRGRGVVMLSEDAAERTLTARVLLFAVQTARWRGAGGCQLDPWDDQAAASVVSIQPPPSTRSPA